MPKSIYLINPSEQCPSYGGLDVLQAWGISNRIAMADLTMPSVAAMIPSSWHITLCDERCQAVDLDTPAEVVGITGKSSQRWRMIELATEFRRRGKLVMLGGPYATLNSDHLRGHADILVRGEIEDIAAKLFSDVETGSWQSEYVGDKPDLTTSPIPRWELSTRGAAELGQVQTSRGCPFECEFCDVIQYLGRKQRWKEPDQVIQELEVLYARGFRGVFFADDNFTVMRRRTRALLARLIEWNSCRPAGRVIFSTQVSIDIARDAEILRMCRQAGFGGVFIGIETSNEESLAETIKRQNLRIDLAEEVGKVVGAGIYVTCGMIVGFDHDDVDIFERQAQFIGRLPVPFIQLNLLMAPHQTPLYQRLAKEGRIAEDDAIHTGSMLTTNIVPKLMTSAQLYAGAKWLANNIYAPSAFAQRLEAFANRCEVEHAGEIRRTPPKAITKALAKRLSAYGGEEHALVVRVERLRNRRPDIAGPIERSLLHYCQARYLLETCGAWDPALARQARPLAA